MEEQYSKLEITPKLIDFGPRVVQMKLLATAGIGTVYPARVFAKPLALVGLLLVAGGYAVQPAYRSFSNQSETSGAIVIMFGGFVLLIGAAIAFTASKRLLVLSLAGGERIVLTEAREMFLETIVARIREAMVAPLDAPIHYTVNITAETIETHSIVDASTSIDNSKTSITAGPGANVMSPGAVGIGGASSAPVSAHASGVAVMPAGARKTNGAANGHDQATAASLAAIVESGKAARPSMVVQAAPGGVAMGGDFRNAGVSVQTSVAADLSAMIGLVERAAVRDQERIVEYLRVLEQLTAAGPSRAVEASNAWAAFFDYAAKALTGIDGFMALAERVNRWFART